jgi:hypothetical protein
VTEGRALALSQSGSQNTRSGDIDSRHKGAQRPVLGAKNHTDHGCCLDPHRFAGLLTAVGFSQDGEQSAVVIPLSCRRWSCVCCRYRLQARNRRRAMLGAGLRDSCVVMLTLTLPGEWHPSSGKCVLSPALRAPESGGRLLTGRQAVARVTLAVASERWKVLNLSLRRLFGSLPYYRAAELHESGVAHLHVLVRVSSRQAWLIRQRATLEAVAAAGFGRSSASIASSEQAVAEYVTKATASYVGKGAEAMPKWSRRGAWSKDWCEWAVPTPIAGFNWQLSRAGGRITTEALRASGYLLMDAARCRVRVAAGPAAEGAIQ